MKKALISKKLLTIPLLLAFVFTLSFTAGGGEGYLQTGQKTAVRTSRAINNNEINLAIDSDKLLLAEFDLFSLVDPTPADNTILTLVYDRLFEVDAAGNILSGLASGINMIDDLTCILTLRQDIFFHNYNHFTSWDVCWVANEAQNYPDSAAYGMVWNQIDFAEPIDDYTVRFFLKAPNRDLARDLALPVAGMACRYDENDNWSWGTGAFKIEEMDSYRARLLRNDNWWEVHNGSISGNEANQINLDFYSDKTSRLHALQSGCVDFAFGIDSYEADDLVQNAEYGLNSFQKTHSLIFNMQSEKVQNPGIRKAISHAIDFAYLVNNMGLSFINPGYTWGPLFNLNGSYNPNLAESILYDIGIEDEFLLKLVVQREMLYLAEVIDYHLEQVGIIVELYMFDELTPRIMQNMDFDMLLTNFSAFTTGAIESMFHTNGNLNYGVYGNPFIDELFDQYRYTGWQNYVFQMQQQLFDDLPMINLGWGSMNKEVYSVHISGISFLQGAAVDLRFAFFYD